MAIQNKQQAEGISHESENIYRTLFERMSDPMLLLKGDRIIDCNAATLKLLAYPTKSDFLNQRLNDISHAFQSDGQSSEEKFEEMIAIAIQAGFHRFEWSHKRYDGLIVPVEVMLRPVIVDGELILHTVWRDITERIRADAAMYQAKEVGRNSIRFYDSKK